MHTWLLIRDPHTKTILPEGLEKYRRSDSGYFRTYTCQNEKYRNDHVFHDNERYTVAHDGILVNQKELLQKYGCDGLCELIIQRYESGDQDFYNEFRGLFNGFVLDKAKERALLYHCHYGGIPLFYYAKDGITIVSPDFGMILDVLKESKMPYSFNGAAASTFFSYRYMLDGKTYAKEVQRLAPGSSMLADGDGLRIKRYFMFDNTDILDVGEEEAVEILDESFTNAVARCLGKNAEYGVKEYLVDLSGGFDSRILNCTAQKLGYKNIINACYSQSNSIDQYASFEMARLLGNEYIYKALDDAVFLYDVDEVVRVNFGLADYSAGTGANHLLKYLDSGRFHFEHTGLLGDTITGTMNPGPRHMSVEEALHMQQKEIPQDIDISMYPNYDLFVLYTDGFLGMLNSMFVRRQYLEVTSPFLDVEFTSASLSMPMEYRYNHKLYRKWIRQKYPDAFDKPSTRCAKPLERLRHFCWTKMQKVLGRNAAKKPSRYYMNPMEHWYATNEDIRRFIHEYYEGHKDLLRRYPETFDAAERLFLDGTVGSKTKVLTVAGVLGRYFS